tara:strand:+ start:83723 stop:84076 length:354 start_codon:yes stop_codon:yes gene_type:complete
MAYTLSGKIKKIFDLQTFPSGFSKREFVVTSTADRFPQDIKFDCLKDKADLLEGVKEGDEVTVHFDLGGREYNGRYFVNVNAWKLDSGSSSAVGSPSSKEPEDTTDYSPDAVDEVPF